MPGGRIDGDETIEETLRRELLEEVPNIRNIAVHEVLSTFRVPRDIDGDTSLVLIFYKVSADFDGEVQFSFEHSQYKWATADQAAKLVDESCQVAIASAFTRTSTG